MSAFRPLNRSQCLVTLVLAAIVSVAVLGGTVYLFVDDTRTPWFRPNTVLARAAEACGVEMTSTARHQCLRGIAHPPMRLASAPDLAAPH